LQQHPAAASPVPVRVGRRREGGPLQVPLAEVPPTQKMPFKGLFCYLSIYLDWVRFGRFKFPKSQIYFKFFPNSFNPYVMEITE
jgi:hypothetical protein